VVGEAVAVAGGLLVDGRDVADELPVVLLDGDGVVNGGVLVPVGVLVDGGVLVPVGVLVDDGAAVPAALVSGAAVVAGSVVVSAAEVGASPAAVTTMDDGVTTSVSAAALPGRVRTPEPAALPAAEGGAPVGAGGTEGSPGGVPGWADAVPSCLARSGRRPAEEAGTAMELEPMSWAAAAGGSVTCGTSSATHPARKSPAASTNDTPAIHGPRRCRWRAGGEMVVSGAA
jgi:hypothetical protein